VPTRPFQLLLQREDFKRLVRVVVDVLPVVHPSPPHLVPQQQQQQQQQQQHQQVTRTVTTTVTRTTTTATTIVIALEPVIMLMQTGETTSMVTPPIPPPTETLTPVTAPTIVATAMEEDRTGTTPLIVILTVTKITIPTRAKVADLEEEVEEEAAVDEEVEAMVAGETPSTTTNITPPPPRRRPPPLPPTTNITTTTKPEITAAVPSQTNHRQETTTINTPANKSSSRMHDCCNLAWEQHQLKRLSDESVPKISFYSERSTWMQTNSASILTKNVTGLMKIGNKSFNPFAVKLWNLEMSPKLTKIITTRQHHHLKTASR
jgi:hypothetical protein